MAVSITETVLLPRFATYTFVPSGETATPSGRLSTFTVAITVFVAVSITETVLLPPLVIYAYVASDEAICAAATEMGDKIELKEKEEAVEAKMIGGVFFLFHYFLSFIYIFS